MSMLEPWGNRLPQARHQVSEPTTTYRSARPQIESFRDRASTWPQFRTVNQRGSQFGNSLIRLLPYGTKDHQESFEMQRIPSRKAPVGNVPRNAFEYILLAHLPLRRIVRNRDAWSALREIIGTVHGPKNWADQHDHYLYGHKTGESSS